MGHDMRAEFVVDAQVLAFAEEVKIDVAEGGREICGRSLRLCAFA